MEEAVEVFLNKDDEINEFFSLSIKEKNKVIALGLLFRKKGLDKIQFWENSEFETKIKTLESEKNLQIAQLEHNLEAKSKQFAESTELIKENQKAIYKNEIDELTLKLKKSDQTLQQQIEKFNNLYTTLSEKHEEKIKENREYFRSETQALRENFNQQQQKKEAKIIELEAKIEKEREKASSLLNINENSALKGKLGERQMINQLNLLFPTSEVSDVHKEGHRGDFILKEGSFIMMVENKAHNKGTNVQKIDIDKLYKDCDDERNNDVQCAIMTALHNGICNREDWEFEVRNGKPILFLHHVSKDWTKLPLAVKFLKLVVEQNNLDLSNKEIQTRFKNVASIIKRNFTKQKKILDKYCSEQKSCISQLQEMMVELFELVKMKY
jgi:hypothetical protein